MQSEKEFLLALRDDLAGVVESNAKYSEQMMCAHEALHKVNVRIRELQVKPCNEMGGGSVGIDTADDFAMYCSKDDRHEGPHSYEEV